MEYTHAQGVKDSHPLNTKETGDKRRRKGFSFLDLEKYIAQITAKVSFEIRLQRHSTRKQLVQTDVSCARLYIRDV